MYAELCEAENNRIHAEKCVNACESVAELLVSKLKATEKCNYDLRRLLDEPKQQAKLVREEFVKVSILLYVGRLLNYLIILKRKLVSLLMQIRSCKKVIMRWKEVVRSLLLVFRLYPSTTQLLKL